MEESPLSKLYFVAGYAKKINPLDVEHEVLPDNSIRWRLDTNCLTLEGYMELGYCLWPWWTVADSHEMAVEESIRKLIEICPLDHGWIDHHVSVGVIIQQDLDYIIDSAIGASEHRILKGVPGGVIEDTVPLDSEHEN